MKLHDEEFGPGDNDTWTRVRVDLASQSAELDFVDSPEADPDSRRTRTLKVENVIQVQCIMKFRREWHLVLEMADEEDQTSFIKVGKYWLRSRLQGFEGFGVRDLDVPIRKLDLWATDLRMDLYYFGPVTWSTRTGLAKP